MPSYVEALRRFVANSRRIPLTADHERQIAAMIQDCIGYPIAVKVTQVERLALSAEGKREEFVRMDEA